MSESLAERGPDGSGEAIRDEVVFVHRRLAIRDRDGGRQPWWSADENALLAYNGELYNDAELRRELVRFGHVFHTRCDTETVMAAYQQWGTDCVHRFRGMFAFGVYDFPRRRVFLARDRYGVKPLFWCRAGESLAFASEPAALLHLPQVSPRPDWPVLSHYLTTFRTTLGSRSIYEGIQTLEPGTWLTCDPTGLHVQRYWNYPTNSHSASLPEAEAIVEHALREAVQVRMVSDVPVGLFVSGGVDSSTIACCVRDAGAEPVAALCVHGQTDQPDTEDDLAFGRRAAKHVGLPFDAVAVGPQDYWDTWRWMVRRTALPISTPNDVLIYRMAVAARRSVGVVLGGEGADELLGGYAAAQWAGADFDRATDIAAGRWHRVPSAARLAERSLHRCYGQSRFASPIEPFFRLNSLIPTAVKPALLQPDVWSACAEDAPLHRHYAGLLDERPDQPTAERYLQLLHRVNLEGLLSRLDQATMLAGLEARVPFTDHHLVEAAFRLPLGTKMAVDQSETAPYLAATELAARGSLKSKIVLRHIARRMMPRRLAERPKASFPTPVARWLRDDWANDIRRVLYTSPFLRVICRPAALQELADNPAAAGMCLWPLLNLGFWGDRVF